jgi:hypothetical protein
MAGENPQKKAKRKRTKSKKRRETGLKIKKGDTGNSNSDELHGGCVILHQSHILYSLPCARNDNSFRIVLKFIS